MPGSPSSPKYRAPAPAPCSRSSRNLIKDQRQRPRSVPEHLCDSAVFSFMPQLPVTNYPSPQPIQLFQKFPTHFVEPHMSPCSFTFSSFSNLQSLISRLPHHPPHRQGPEDEDHHRRAQDDRLK